MAAAAQGQSRLAERFGDGTGRGGLEVVGLAEEIGLDHLLSLSDFHNFLYFKHLRACQGGLPHPLARASERFVGASK